jgi:hypothetical protein
MKLEFIADGSQDCPLVRIYDFGPEEAVSLRQFVASLCDGSRKSVQLDGETGFESIGGCRLTLQLGKRDFGLVQKAQSEFACVLTQDGWNNVAHLIEPFCASGCSGHQWLNEDGDASLLLSKTGQW